MRQSLIQLAIQYSSWTSAQSLKESAKLLRGEAEHQEALRRSGAHMKR
ncbi:hypothetical protein [Paenibacillus apiarius]|uniref:Uncharacterized protein n=1 Tax=Paenibacillus apiarius TaxID=46240 RepID=A0ABT4DXF2_9BACL|nr:hypothetical protein [Paenibacillus apiarius]MBN3525712.1 hypothetical protein [Paenibacillus apiarius]MCY9512927.1 hypothetical protein [Paenibacillus apiarius]MCY9522024.1 hypothetical protein [Paenibacillus apiarius]MCY9555069.1 hypothetical protein [Paenibacillus apiarius]MCY9558089.1 hypothetical protein [Paenibacillus apiarius]